MYSKSQLSVLFEEELSALLDGLRGSRRGVSHSLWRFVDLVVVSTLVRLISEKMDLVKILLDELQAERLVPSFGENIEADLTPNRERKSKVREFSLEFLNKILPDAMNVVILLESISLLLATVPTYRRHVQHSISKFNERSSLHWYVNVCYLLQREVDELLQLILS